MTATRILLRGGTIMSMDPDVGDLTGDVLIEGDAIVAIGSDLGVDRGAAEVIDATNHAVLPGFVDGHRHLFQTLVRGLGSEWSLFQYFMAYFAFIGPQLTADDVYLANYLGALDALDSGVTAVFDYSQNCLTSEHADEAVRALQDSGIRAVFGFGGSIAQYAECLAPPHLSSTPSDPHETRRLRNRMPSDTSVVTMGFAARGPEISTMDVVTSDWHLARELGLRVTSHLGQGMFPAARPSVIALEKADLLDDQLTIAHANFLTDEELMLMADRGVAVVVTPEDEALMGHGWSPIARLMASGIRPNLGIDTCMAVGGDPFTAMRVGLAVHRGLANAAVLDTGQNVWDPKLNAREVLEMATIEGARALGLGHRTGSLKVGKQADVILVDLAHVSTVPVHDPVVTVVQHAGRHCVDEVIVAGKRIKRDGRLVGVDHRTLHRNAAVAADDLLARAGVNPGWKPGLPS